MTTHIQALQEACLQLNIPLTQHDAFGDFVSIEKNGERLYFHNQYVPLNSAITAHLSKDKAFHYTLLSPAIRMPKTIAYLDPHVDTKYESYQQFSTHKAIVRDLEANFSYPLIIKKNKGSQGSNVFYVQNRRQSIHATRKIFDKKSRAYDYIALAQEFITTKTEYRVVILDKTIQFAYEKIRTKKKLKGNISPLHEADSLTKKVYDHEKLEQLNTFIQPMFGIINLEYGGLDIIEDQNGELWLIEINSAPGFAYYVKDNGIKDVVSLYEQVLMKIRSSEKRR